VLALPFSNASRFRHDDIALLDETVDPLVHLGLFEFPMTIISGRCGSNVLINRFSIAMVKVLGACDQIGIPSV
jgi:hypothetical protein